MSKKWRRSKRGIWTRQNYVKLVKSIKKLANGYWSGSKSFVWWDGWVGNILMEKYMKTKYVTYNIYHPNYNPNGNTYWA